MTAVFALALSFDPEAAASAIRAWHEQRETEVLSRVVVSPVPGRPDLVVAICDYEDEWWGFFSLYHLTSGVVDWEAGMSSSPSEQSIHRVCALRVEGFNNLIIEAFAKTHMGNGSLYLYELREQDLHLLLTTKAVDFHSDGETFRNGTLVSEYRDVNGDGSVDVVLQGEIDAWHDREEVVLRSRPCRKVCLWISSLGQFVEAPSLEEGFSEPPSGLRLPLILASSSLLLATCCLLLTRR